MKDYSKRTYESGNLLRRYAQRTRFSKALQLVKENSTGSVHLLDVGTGDGFFLQEIEPVVKGDFIGLEPYMEPLENVRNKILGSWPDINNYVVAHGKFDIVTSFEVFEHLNAQLQSETLQQIANVLKKNGVVIISVPIELSFPSLIKNIFRKISAGKNDDYYTWKRIWKSIWGKPIPECRQEAYLSHMGFYYTDLEKIFQERYKIENKFYSPLPYLGYNFNSQVFYVLKKL
ncbi:class I SAM-dependent methyltransferase [uncultured Parabacteroides sp.]|uniref:class I SAM-dependent methyltransferase n=1 Tax=uncultured Parabacteroides sp. TaxID=512312 RepID=UPI002589F483|nr:class I SAM-dependent methyltransferase [uncultured Parabacteroides sp.]